MIHLVATMRVRYLVSLRNVEDLLRRVDLYLRLDGAPVIDPLPPHFHRRVLAQAHQPNALKKSIGS